MKRVKSCIPIPNIPILISLHCHEEIEKMHPQSLLLRPCLVFTSMKRVKNCIPIPFTVILSCFSIHSHDKSEEMRSYPKYSDPAL
jgi:hypothetical protein